MIRRAFIFAAIVLVGLGLLMFFNGFFMHGD
jgi:hypothetical protein